FHFVLVTDFWCALFQPVGEHRNLHSFPTRRSSDLHVARLLGDDAVVSLGLDARKLQLLPEDLGQLVEADVDLEEVMAGGVAGLRSEEHTSELQSRENLVCRLLLEKKKEREVGQVAT